MADQIDHLVIDATIDRQMPSLPDDEQLEFFRKNRKAVTNINHEDININICTY